MKKMSDYEMEMEQEIENRISQLENEIDIEAHFNIWDWIFVGITILAGLGIILYGIL